MNDESISDEIDVLDPEWKRAWGQLRASGYSDDEIWAMAASVEDASWPEDPPPGKEKEHYYAELIDYILNLRDRVLNEEQPPSVWIEAGILVSVLCSLAGQTDQAKDDFSKRQKSNSQGTRNRKSLINDVVDFVMDTIPSGERNLDGFRRYIQGADRLKLSSAVIEVTPYENEAGKITHYVLEDKGKSELAEDALIHVPVGSITSSISRYPERLSKRPKS